MNGVIAESILVGGFVVLWPTFAIVSIKHLGMDQDEAVLTGLGAAFLWPLTFLYLTVHGIVWLATRKEQQ